MRFHRMQTLFVVAAMLIGFAAVPETSIAQFVKASDQPASTGFVRASDQSSAWNSSSAVQPIPSALAMPVSGLPPYTATACNCVGTCTGKCGASSGGCTGEGCTSCLDGTCSSCNKSGINWGVWASQGVSTSNLGPANPPGGSGNAPVLLNYLNDEYMLNQAYGFIEKTADNGGCGLAIGARVDVMYGTDYFQVTSPGLEENQDGTQHWNTAVGNGLLGEGRMGLALPQAYVDLAWNNVTVRAGHFYSLTQYESMMAPQNFFYSHSYMFSYSSPFTLSGALAMISLTDRFEFQVGIVNGWNNLTTIVDRPAAIAKLIWRSRDHRTMASFAFISGDEVGSAPPILGTRTMINAQLSHYFMNTCWQYVIEHNAAWQQSGGSNGDPSAWYGVSQYLFYEFSDQMRAGVRYEWFNDQTGGRVPSTVGGAGANYFELTAGINYEPHPNVMIRPEVRFDWATFHTPGAGTSFAYASGSPNQQNSQRVFGVDAIISF